MLTLLLYAGLALATPANSMNDADLDTVLASKRGTHQSAVVYTWSPNMNLSVRGLDEFLTWAKEKRILPIVLLDPKCDSRTALAIVQKHGWDKSNLKVNEAQKLIKLGMRVHYPSYLFTQGGAVVGPVIPGYKSRNELNSLYRRYIR